MSKIKALINQKADTRKLSDSEFDDGSAAGASSDNIVEVMPSASTVCTAVACRAPSPPLCHASSPPPCRPCMNAPELVNQLLKAFDPMMAKARENERAERSFQTTHMLTLSQQLCNSQNSIENLWNQLTVMQARMHDTEHGCELAELKLQFSHVGSGPVFGGYSADPSTSRCCGCAAVYKANPDLIRHDGQVRCERLMLMEAHALSSTQITPAMMKRRRRTRIPACHLTHTILAFIKTTASPSMMTTLSFEPFFDLQSCGRGSACTGGRASNNGVNNT
ncbi:hypothetical protein B0H19DRAFT_1256152 [Mycena capillaripes]|nr:hypothetical protein B0H19DRAFT_1256152 [Mycena capillaripes]